MTETEAKKILLLESINKALNSIKALLHSADKILPFKPDKTYSLDELEPYDALTSRFERAVEVCINKLFRSIQYYETGAKEGTIRDTLNLMIKLDIIEDTEQWMNMRDIRNRITHDYLPEKLAQIYVEITEKYIAYFKSLQKKLKHYLKQKDINE